MNENNKETFCNREAEDLCVQKAGVDKSSGKSAANRKWLVFGLLLVFFGAFVGLQMWGSGEFQKSINRTEQDVRKLNERLRLLENTAGERNVLAFLSDIESLSKQCQGKVQTLADLKRQWWFVLPFLKKRKL